MTRLLPRSLLLLLAAAWTFAALPAQAAVTITFWSHEFGNSFPHAFVTLRGTPDAGGAPVDTAFGFTAKAVTPAILLGDVAGTLDIPKTNYIENSDAQFSVVLTDAQYAQELALAQAWDGKSGTRYNLGKRNCIHFVKEAARIAGLAGLDFPRLMKRPRSYLLAVGAANAGTVTTIALKGDAYFAALPPLASASTAASTPLPQPFPAPTTVLPIPDFPTPAPGARARDLHVAPPSRLDQPAGRISMTSSVEANAG